MLSLFTNKAGNPFSWCNLILPNITNVDICELFFSRRLKMNVLISYVVRKLFNNETRPPKLTMETVAETYSRTHKNNKRMNGNLYGPQKPQETVLCTRRQREILINPSFFLTRCWRCCCGCRVWCVRDSYRREGPTTQTGWYYTKTKKKYVGISRVREFVSAFVPFLFLNYYLLLDRQNSCWANKANPVFK